MDEDARKRKIEYNLERNRQLRQDKIVKDFKATLPYEDVEEINKTLNKKSMNKVQFIQWAHKKLKEDVVDLNTNNEIITEGKKVIQRYIPVMNMKDREIIKEFIEKLNKKDA